MPHIPSRYATSRLNTPGSRGRGREPGGIGRSVPGAHGKNVGTASIDGGDLQPMRGPAPDGPAQAIPAPEARGLPSGCFPASRGKAGTADTALIVRGTAFSASGEGVAGTASAGYDFSEHGFCLSLLHEAPARKSRQRRWQARAACSAVLRHDKESDNGRYHTGIAAAGRVRGDA